MSEVLDAAPAPAAAPVGPPPPPPPGPIAQSVAIGFRAVYIAAFFAALLWLTSNVHEIAPDTQAIVLRFGKIVRTQEAGLLIAWPRPIEQVELLPGPERQLSEEVTALPAASEKARGLVGPFDATESIPQNVGAYLTGDGNVVLLDATLIYRINDPVAYALEQAHVAAALARLFRATTVQITAGRNLNDFLVVQASGTEGADNQAVVALRSEARESLLRSMNARLGSLADSGAALGVTLERIDMTAWLPPMAKSAFDAVLVATQAADRGVAIARTDAERRRQEADRERDQLLSAARATALEHISNAGVETARILALAQEETPATRGSVLLREYRAGVSDIMNRVGSATLIDPQSGARFVLPGKPTGRDK